MNLEVLLRRRTRKLRLAILLSVFCVGYFGTFLWYSVEDIFSLDKSESVHFSSRKLLNTTESSSDPLYPPNTFTDDELKHGAVVLYVIGMIYMFVALALVCDEFFVPALGVIIQKFNISEDVAGATFMAAGGSAPELFTSIIGVFLAKSNVGIGTIVGSAVFNILFVIGMCAIVSKGVLQLTWWPLFRDVFFYCIDLIVLIICFWNQYIHWYEAFILFLLYISYVTFMKFNHQIEKWVKSKLPKTQSKVSSSSQLVVEKPERCLSVPILHSGGNRFRHGILELIVHHTNQHKESKPHNKAMHLHAIATLKVIIGTTHTDDPNAIHVDNENNTIQTISNGHVTDKSDGVVLTVPGTPNQSSGEGTNSEQETGEQEEQLEEEEEPLDLSWPSDWKSRIMYVIVAPLIFPLWITLPDVRREEKKKWFMVTFFGSILWIGIFSYLMVWWASVTGTTIGISDEIMGLTILAAGTSIPDLITSVIVAKKGFGDMAVSSSVGSNIFDITVGLPLPWLLYSAIYTGDPIPVDNDGLVCSVILLFLMLLLVIIVIAVSKWKMSRILGIAMLILYIIFVIMSVLLALKIIDCPDLPSV